jgi:hypothetical protein
VCPGLLKQRPDNPVSEPTARRTEQLFKLVLAVKGVDGAAELIGAVALLLVSGATCSSW